MTNISYGEMELRLAHARKQGAADGFQQGWHAALQRIREGDKIHDLAELVPKCDEPAKPEAAPMRNAESPSGVQALGSSGLITDDDDPIRIALEDLNLHCTDHAPDPDCEGCRKQLEGFRFDSEDDDDSYLWQRCYVCGHRLAFASDSCPQCGIRFQDGDDPPNWPEKCQCDRCRQARESSI